MKRLVYIISFSFLGLLLGFLIHSVIEIAGIDLLVGDFEKYSLGFSVNNWFFIHKIWAGITLGGGLLFGFFQGKYWWRVLYKNK